MALFYTAIRIGAISLFRFRLLSHVQVISWFIIIIIIIDVVVRLKLCKEKVNQNDPRSGNSRVPYFPHSNMDVNQDMKPFLAR